MIQLKNITKDYYMGSNKVEALKGINITFRENEFVAILGPSGGGKTTTLNIIGGLDIYSSGDLIINGKSTNNFTDRDWDSYRNHSVGFVFQSYNLIPHQTVLSNVELALTISEVSKKERRERAIKALESVGLGDQINKKPNQLSGGQMQRVAIARALVNNPDILLADEPTGALDTQSSVQIMDILKEVAKDRLVVMVTHNPELAEEYATRIVRLVDGQIISDTNPYEVEKQENTFNAGKTNMGILTALSLSLNNLMTKKGRTILTAFAGSIGIIGIALILSLSTGVNKYIEDVQRDSLSSYPLTIEASSADMTNMMLGMMGTVESTETKEGQISEVMVASEMFAHIGPNDIKSFNRYMLDNFDDVQPMLSSLKYNYGTTIHIYKNDTSEGIIKLNPSTLLSSFGSSTSSSMASSMGFSSVFQEMMDNKELLENQYDVIAGRWPEKFDECIMVVMDEHTMSDFMSYQLGLRDPQEFVEMIMNAYSGKATINDKEPLKMNYDDLLNIEYKVINPSDWYKYNAEFDIYEDMSTNEDFMKQVIADGLSLKVVGIVTTKQGASSSALMPGVAYTKDLTEYMIKKSQESELVQKQLANKEIDVFTGETFEDLNNNERKGLDFSNMISVDEKMISTAFGVNINTNDIMKIVSSYLQNSLASSSDEITELMNDTSNVFGKLLKGFYQYFLKEYGVFDVATYDMNKIEKVVNAYLDTAEAADILATLNKYGIDNNQGKAMFAELLITAFQSYYDACISMGLESGIISSDNMMEVLEFMLKDTRVTTSLATIIEAISKDIVTENVNSIINNLARSVLKEVSKSFRVDGNKIAQAFKFNMNEEELARVMSSMMYGDIATNKYSYDNNMQTLSYGDLESPISISFFFNTFENKQSFKDFVDAYNESAPTESKITYTDVTGILMGSITTIIDAISYVLIAFVSVSLIVSSIMIGIITYISVLERTKEIGILRALGASKRDVGNVFSAETFIIGLISGLVGIGMTLLLCIPINAIIHKVTKIPTLGAVLPTSAGIVLVIISVILTLIAGLIPSSMATKCDPVTALRSE